MISFEVGSARIRTALRWQYAWVTRELKAAGKVTLSRVFFFRSSDLVAETAHGAAHDDEADEDDRPLYRFRFATTKDGYHRIPGRILGIDNDVLIVAEGIALDRKVFVAERNISIFRRIAKLKPGSEIVVGGDRVDSIAVEAFGELLEIRRPVRGRRQRQHRRHRDQEAF